MHTRQKALNKLQHWCKYYQKDKEILVEKMTYPQTESSSDLKVAKKCDFYFITIQNSNSTTYLSSLQGIYLSCISTVLI